MCQQWSYVSLALTYRYENLFFFCNRYIRSYPIFLMIWHYSLPIHYIQPLYTVFTMKILMIIISKSHQLVFGKTTIKLTWVRISWQRCFLAHRITVYILCLAFIDSKITDLDVINFKYAILMQDVLGIIDGERTVVLVPRDGGPRTTFDATRHHGCVTQVYEKVLGFCVELWGQIWNKYTIKMRMIPSKLHNQQPISNNFSLTI